MTSPALRATRFKPLAIAALVVAIAVPTSLAVGWGIALTIHDPTAMGVFFLGIMIAVVLSVVGLILAVLTLALTGWRRWGWSSIAIIVGTLAIFAGTQFLPLLWM